MEDRPPPAPELLAEAREFAKLIEDMLDRSEESGGETLRFTLTVSREVALMAAWVIFKEDMMEDGEPSVLPRPLMLHLPGGAKARDWQRARDYMQRAIFDAFDTDYTNLMMGTHPLLFPQQKSTTDVLPEEPDDDIPF